VAIAIDELEGCHEEEGEGGEGLTVGGRPVAQLEGGASMSTDERVREQGDERARQGRPIFPQIGRLMGSVFLLIRHWSSVKLLSRRHGDAEIHVGHCIIIMLVI
jgi:hypothetical protein